MNLKTYQADSMAKALAQVKKDLGPDAIILNTRTLKVGGMMGVGARSRVEITATDQDDVLQSGRYRPRINAQSGKSMSQSISRADGAAVNDRTTFKSSQPADSPRAASTDVALQNMTGEVAALKSMVQSLVAESRKSRLSQLPESLCELYEELISRDVADELAQEFVGSVADDLTGDQAADRALVRQRLREKIESMLPDDTLDEGTATGSPRIVALIGPTGVGKTTTIAKLAANSRLREKKRVGLLTTDTYRIAAVEQLRTYARIIDVPVEVAVTPDDVAPALKRMPDCDVIYIDTAGRSQNNAPRLDELHRFLKAAQPHQIHLVLSGAAGHKALLRTAERFKPLGVSSIIFTKLDEAVGFGVILNVLCKVDRKLAFITNGQSVPNDIQKADRTSVADWILGKKEHPESSAVGRNGAMHDQGV